MHTDTKKPEVLVTMSITQGQIDRLKAVCHVKQAGWGVTGSRLSEDELCDCIGSVEILLVGYENITRRVFDHAKNLKILGVSRANPVNIDIDRAREKQIPLIFTPGRNAIAAAEFTIGLMLNQARNIGKGDRLLRSGRFLGEPAVDFFAENSCKDVIWNLDGDTPYTQLRGVELATRTLGLIGFGNVAARVAMLAKAFGMRVITHTPERDKLRTEELAVQVVSLEDLLRESDFVSIHCSVNEDSKSLIDECAFAQMKPSAYIINTARASIIDQSALINALQHNKIAGAALDVFWYEPLPSNHPLLTLDNVTLTPHLAGSTHEVPERHSKMIVDEVMAWLENRPLKNVYNGDVFSKCE
jgi:D-3-phosphoglycerate dehydrogenase / 2-oxoglutarate reductase